MMMFQKKKKKYWLYGLYKKQHPELFKKQKQTGRKGMASYRLHNVLKAVMILAAVNLIAWVLIFLMTGGL